MKNQIHIDKDFGWFIGGFDNNQKHRHYALQLSIPLDGQITIITSDNTIKTDKPILIKSNVVHNVSSENQNFLLLINPASTIGHYWNQLSNSEIREISNEPTTKLRDLIMGQDKNKSLISDLNSIITEYDCFCISAIHKGDERMNIALAYLTANSEQIVPLEDVANHCNLSSSRFLHLFKEQTGITYRRAQLWNKIMKGITQFGKMSLTEIAHCNGFSDSAHFSRTFKEHFGFSPRDFLKISQYVFFLLFGVVANSIFCLGQKVTTSTFNLTLVPGLSNVGLDPSNNYSYFTFNILSGYQRGNYYMGISGLSSSNIEQANGLQIAGLVNMVGVDYYQGLTPKEVIKAESSGEEPFLRGIQVSSLMNFVRGHSTGAQISLGMNISKSYTDGAQIGGLLNYSGKLLSGAQLGFVANVAAGSTQGVQLALYNRTRDELSGFQLGAINLAHDIEGKNSIMETESTGIQIGLVNYSKTMNGFQIGLINLSGPNQGTQIGLINIYKTPRKKGKLDSTPIGILNIGNSSSIEAFVDETFLMNFSISTGNIKNGGLLPANKVKHIMNQITFRQAGISKSAYKAYGWNWQKQFYNYSPDIMNEFYFFSIGLGTSYVDFKDAGNKTNLLSEIGFTAGSRLFPKNRSVYLFATVDANYFYSNNGQTLGPENLTLSFGEGEGVKTHELWPGISIGLKLK